MATGMSCEQCARSATYRFATPAGESHARCLRHAVLYPAVFRHAVRVALIVGAMLFAINQLDVVLRGDLTPLVAAKIALTFAVPFCVSTYSALQINRLSGAA
ncbi:MAG TPA: nitrate/nitrite transporter NrtS [Thermomicrobiales bacterium]|nr:nitrate/nitrite transporter NrtS [Thermomicrobiales bacterium]